MEKNLLVWPKSDETIHINYHYTQFGEIVNYLNKMLPNNQVEAIDEDISEQDVVRYIVENNIEKVILQVNYENAHNSFILAKKIKKNTNIPVMAYGALTVMLSKLFLVSDFDAIYKSGDYEDSIYSFIKYFDKTKEYDKLRGILVIRDGEFFETKQGRYIDPLQWGMSDIREVPIKEYDKIKKKDRYVLNLSRGCPFGCNHCLIQLTEGRKERRRDIYNAKCVLSLIKNKYKHIKIWAANFTLDKNYVEQFCEMVSSNFPDITWECATRIDLVSDIDMLNKMYESGCRQISLGIESLNNEELIGTKKFKSEQIGTAIDNVQSTGIKVKGCIMLGLPNQTKESVINTIEFLKNRNVIIRPTIYTPYHQLDESIELEELSHYNRKTYKNTNIPDIEYEQLLKLVKNPYDYKKILNLEKEDNIHDDLSI